MSNSKLSAKTCPPADSGDGATTKEKPVGPIEKGSRKAIRQLFRTEAVIAVAGKLLDGNGRDAVERAVKRAAYRNNAGVNSLMDMVLSLAGMSGLMGVDGGTTGRPSKWSEFLYAMLLVDLDQEMKIGNLSAFRACRVLAARNPWLPLGTPDRPSDSMTRYEANLTARAATLLRQSKRAREYGEDLLQCRRLVEQWIERVGGWDEWRERATWLTEPYSVKKSSKDGQSGE